MKFKIYAITLVVSLSLGGGVFAEGGGYHVSQGDFGGVGLMQMPTGRMDKEGAFYLNGSFNEEYYRYSVSIQLFPWLESTLRYTDTRTRLYSGSTSFSNNNTQKDKGIDVKFRLLEESYWLPETSLGFRDIGGTGLFDSEFLAMSKRYGPWDFTLGMGWGYMAKSGNISNPFCKVKNNFCRRDSALAGNGGEVQAERFFRGDAALFAGIEYQTPLEPLSLKLEYDANDYQGDFAGDLRQDSRFNFGANYKIGKWSNLQLSYQRGNTINLGFSLGAQFSDLHSAWVDEAPARPQQEKPAVTAKHWRQLARQLEQNAGYQATKIYQAKESVTLVGKQAKYRDRNEALERASALLWSASNDTIKHFHIIESKSHTPLVETKIERKAYQQYAHATRLNAQFSDAVQRQPPQEPQGELKYQSDKRWSYGISPVFSPTVGGAENDLLYSLGIGASVKYWLSENIELSGGLYFNLLDNFDQFNFIIPPDGTDQLRVRTLVRDYIDEPVIVNRLQATWYEHLSENFYGQLYAGYLEAMFAGVGSELLYRPLDSRWAVGFDLNFVSQRRPDSTFGLFDQERQFSVRDGQAYRVAHRQSTGHLSVYYQPQWQLLKNTLVQVSAGKYLAGDKGITVDFSKQFKSGVIVGAYASKTDMSTEEFGEGSFTKGFYISIPFDVMTVLPSTSRALIHWQPITRDGGQKLRRSELYKVTDARSPWYTRPSAF